MKNILFCFLAILLVQCQPVTSDTATTSDTSETTDKPSTTITKTDYRIGFYNVENLFDLEDAPRKADEDFTPNGKQKWTQERYDKKINDLAKVIAAMDMPEILGLCEVENEAVVKDLAANKQLSDGKYKVVHRESPDHRGIDVALMYNSDWITIEDTKSIEVAIPDNITGEKGYTTRAILQVTASLADGQPLYVFVNHWPSRRGGVDASSPKREYVAAQLRKAVDKVLANDENAHIVITGDFNDETDNKSITSVLQAKAENTNAKQELINTSAALDNSGKGSYNYRGNWNMLDQFIVSDNFFDGKGLEYKTTIVFQEEWMMYKSKNGLTPNRTYGGPNYYGGFSDHLPVYIDVEVVK